MTEQAIIPTGKGEITQTAMIFTGKLEFDEWLQIGQQLKAMSQGLMFWIGDWLNYGEERYGEAYAQAMDVTGYSYRTVKQAKYIANKFPPDERSDDLTFTHYTAVAGEEPERAKELLQQAATESLTVEELKIVRRGTDMSSPTEEKVPCPTCGQMYHAE